MGCNGSRGTTGLHGLGAKKWLKIEGVAASVQTFPRIDGHDGITVVAAGMDRYGLVGILERSFHQRGFGIESGEWSVKGSLFHGTFQLHPLSTDVQHSSLSCGFQAGKVVSLRTEFCDASHNFVCKQHRGLQPRLLQVDVDHTMDDELHVVLLSVLNVLGGRIVRGTLQRGYTSRSDPADGSAAALHHDRDSFWVDIQDPHILLDGVFASPQALQDRLLAQRRSLEEEEDRATVVSTLTEPIPGDTTSDRLLNALRRADHRALHKSLLELPTVVLEIVKKRPYELKHSSWGYQLNGFHKYFGSGIILQDKTGSEGQAPVLQFTTLFVQQKDVAEKGNRWKLAALRADRQYALFTNSIDVNRQRFTIEMVFLNGICPAGQNIGAIASAEQLFAPVWENGAAGLGCLLPIHRIQEIKLKDVVNWNTYALISFALSQRGIRKDELGETFQASINEELRAANLTRDACKALPLLDIVLRTQLGKFVSRILSQWHEKTAVRLKCTSAEASFTAHQVDYIAGEARALLAVIIQVEVEYKSTLRQISPEGASALQQNQPSAVTTSGEAALAEWMAQIRASIGDIDHGFRLGSRGDADTADMSIPVMRSLNRAIRELQLERGRSCEAVAEDLSLEEERVDALSKQRHIVDGVFVEVLELTDASIMREIFSHLILLRSVVDKHVASSQSWEGRYRIICTDPRSFNSLIGTLIEWLTSACKISPAIDAASAETIRLFCYFSEQLGRERAFVLARGKSLRDRSTSKTDEDGLRDLALMSLTRTLIGDLLQLNSAVFQNFETKSLYDDMQDGKDWFETISPCIDACHDLVRNLLDEGHEVCMV